jgi:deazaflavin-dependent oxidoreductase (nitroreductase family)
MGPNALLTVRGRSTGLPRTTPVALVAIGGRRWIISIYGEVNWARNLRAAGQGTVTIKGRPEAVRAIELSPDQATDFFRDILTPYVKRLPGGRLILKLLGGSDIVSDPAGAARRLPVFELKPAANAGDQATGEGPISR